MNFLSICFILQANILIWNYFLRYARYLKYEIRWLQTKFDNCDSIVKVKLEDILFFKKWDTGKRLIATFKNMAYISCDGRPSDSFVIVHHTFDMNMNLKCSLDFSFIVDLSVPNFQNMNYLYHMRNIDISMISYQM